MHSEADRRVIETLGEVLAGSDRPLVVTSGTGLVRSKTGGAAAETDDHLASAEFPRAASEEAADALIANGGRVMVMRLPQVHDTRRQGRITQHILLARQKGWVAYVGEGNNRLPARSTFPTPCGFTGWRWSAARQARATTPSPSKALPCVTSPR